ncbi:MAG: FIST C-terminal domain-containing protein [Candidatus Poribacteria bacterium]|nr:FIST C-terminal domain-containing protein [Candidatus Poribacteria bacterium]
MIRAGVGHSLSISTSEAAEHATTMAMGKAKLAKAELALVFATVHYQGEYEQLFDRVQEISGCDHLIGCSGMSVLTSEGEFEGESAVAVLVMRSDQLSAVPFLVSEREGESVGTTIRDRIQPEFQENSLLVVLPDLRCISPAQLVEQIGADGQKLPIVGGAASGDPMSGQMYQWSGKQIAEASVSGVLLTGSFRTEIGVAQGCQPIGHPLEITRAEGNRIFELNGKPALAVFRESMALLTEEDIQRSGRMVFLGLAMDTSNRAPKIGDYLIRNITGVDSQHSVIGVAEKVEDGQIVQFHLRNPFAAQEEIQGIISRLGERTRAHPPAFGLYFNCLGRGKGLYGDANHDIQAIKRQFPDLPIIGFFGNAEFAPIGNRNFAHTYTGALVLFSET